jgi:hypothetical protein
VDQGLAMGLEATVWLEAAVWLEAGCWDQGLAMGIRGWPPHLGWLIGLRPLEAKIKLSRPY